MGLIEEIVGILLQHSGRIAIDYYVALLYIVAKQPENQERALKVGAVRALLLLLDEDRPDMQYSALGCLLAILDNPKSHKEFLNLGGLDEFERMMDPTFDLSRKNELANTLVHIAASDISNLETIVESSMIATLCKCLRHHTLVDSIVKLANLMTHQGVQFQYDLATELCKVLLLSINKNTFGITTQEILRIVVRSMEYYPVIGDFVQRHSKKLKKVFQNNPPGDKLQAALCLLYANDCDIKQLDSTIVQAIASIPFSLVRETSRVAFCKLLALYPHVHIDLAILDFMENELKHNNTSIISLLNAFALAGINEQRALQLIPILMPLFQSEGVITVILIMALVPKTGRVVSEATITYNEQYRLFAPDDELMVFMEYLSIQLKLPHFFYSC